MFVVLLHILSVGFWPHSNLLGMNQLDFQWLIAYASSICKLLMQVRVVTHHLIEPLFHFITGLLQLMVGRSDSLTTLHKSFLIRKETLKAILGYIILYLR